MKLTIKVHRNVLNIEIDKENNYSTVTALDKYKIQLEAPTSKKYSQWSLLVQNPEATDEVSMLNLLSTSISTRSFVLSVKTS